MARCVSFITIVDHGFGSWLGYHHQYDYECNSTGTNIALFYTTTRHQRHAYDRDAYMHHDHDRDITGTSDSAPCPHPPRRLCRSLLFIHIADGAPIHRPCLGLLRRAFLYQERDPDASDSHPLSPRSAKGLGAGPSQQLGFRFTSENRTPLGVA